METFINNRYQIEEKLGQGGMGTVYRAHDNALDREVAIKILSNTDLGTQGRARLIQEARMIARLNHPNIVTVHDVGEIEGTPFIVMELVEGVDLYQHKPSSITEIIAIAQQLCSALEHAHHNEIIHRDLKPENIIITPDGTTKLMDFGLARSVASRLTTEGTIVGTVFYLAPEQALGQSIDYRSDLYALGVLLYELLTGQLPFQADDQIAVISQHIHAPVVPPRARNERIPIFLNDLVLRLMAKAPEDRPASAQEVRLLLETPASLETEISPPGELSVLDRIVRGRIVGREVELQQASQLWGQATRGEGQLLMISGEPGVGKSRLMREIVTQVEVGGGQAYIGESQAEGNAPYAAFGQIARRALRAQGQQLEIPDLVMAELISITPELQLDYPDVPPNAPLEPDSERRRLFECLARFITALSEKKPLLLVFEDLHWADSGTLGLLRFLAQRMQEMPIMLLGTYRQVELDQALPFHETLLDLNRRNLGTRLKLERLDQHQTGEMLAVLFTEQIHPEFLDGIYRETEGNPFFVEEVCKALVESGALYFADGEWHRPDMADLQIPQSIKVAVQSRLSKLSTDAQEILLNAAVIGRQFDYQTLQQVAGKDEDILIGGLEAALKAQLIEERREEKIDIFEFSHALISAALREGLSGLRRKRLHRQVAQVIEELQPQAYQRLAYHWGEAGDEDKGLDYTIKAADQARKRYANEDALRLYTEALALLPEDHEDRFDLLAARAGVYDLTAQREAQLADIEAMLDFADKQNQAARQVDALLALAKLYIHIEPSRAQEPAERAAEIAKQLGDIERQARAASVLGINYRNMGDFHFARRQCESAVELARSAGLKRDLADYLSLLSNLHSNMFRGELAFSINQEAVDLSKEIEDKALQAHVTRQLASVYSSCKEYEKALRMAEEALQMARQIGDISSEQHTLNIKGGTERDMGVFSEAEAIFLEGIHRPDIFSLTGCRFMFGNLLSMYQETAEVEKGLNLVLELLEKARQAGSEYWENMLLKGTLEDLYFQYGKYFDGLRISESRIPYFEKSWDQGRQAGFLSFLGFWAAAAGDFELAYKYLETARLRCDGLDTSPDTVHVLINSSRVALLDGSAEALKIGLAQCARAVDLLKNFENPPDWQIPYTLAGLHLANIEENPSYAGDALAAIEQALAEYAINPYFFTIIPREHLFFRASRVYRANQRPEEADDYLRQAYERVMLVAEKTKDDDLRQSYLENVPDNRKILKEARARGWHS